MPMFFLEYLLTMLMAFFVSFFMNNSLYADEPSTPPASEAIVSDQNVTGDDEDATEIISKPLQPLFIQDVQHGTGATAESGKNVLILYAAYESEENGGKLVEYRGKASPVTFKVGSEAVDEAINQGLLGNDKSTPMREGGKRRVIAPAETNKHNKPLQYDLHLLKVL